MKKKLFITFLVLWVLTLGCNSKTEFLNTNLKRISVYEYIRNKNDVYISKIPMNKICTITNIDSINEVLSVLNRKKPEFAVFMPKYHISLEYADTTIEIGVNQKFIKIKGRTFKLRDNLSIYFAR